MKPFHFKQFTIEQDQCPMQVGTDGVLLGAWAEVADAKNALDIGTGTGLIAIMLAQRNANLRVAAVEIDATACAQAQTNFENSPFADRLTANAISIQDFLRSSDTTYDLIVSNPPFFSGGTFSKSQERNQVRHTIKMPHNALLQAARRLLNKDGKFCVVLPFIEGLRFQELASQYGLHCTKITEVRPTAAKEVERLLIQMEWQEKELQQDELIIQKKKRNDWTEDYIKLTGDFYLKM